MHAQTPRCSHLECAELSASPCGLCACAPPLWCPRLLSGAGTRIRKGIGRRTSRLSHFRWHVASLLNASAMCLGTSARRMVIYSATAKHVSDAGTRTCSPSSVLFFFPSCIPALPPSPHPPLRELLSRAPRNRRERGRRRRQVHHARAKSAAEGGVGKRLRFHLSSYLLAHAPALSSPPCRPP